MYLQLLVAALMALSGLAAAAHPAQESAAPRQPVLAVGAQTAALATANPPTARPAVVSVKKIDIVVPPVNASGPAAAPNAPLENQASSDVVVADQLVASKRVQSEVVETSGFQTVGVTWPKGAKVDNLGSQIRTRNNGTWSAWAQLEPIDSGPDAGTPEAARALASGTDARSIGHADAVQLAFSASDTGGPKGLSLALIGSAVQPTSSGAAGSPSTSNLSVQSAAYSTARATTEQPAYSTDRPTTEQPSYSTGVTTADTAVFSTGPSTDTAVFATGVDATDTAVVPVAAVAAAPVVIPRSAWGAPAQACRPDVASTLVGATVHHTADSNSYANQAAAMQQIRNDAVYHISRLGWCDLGYNFVVDKWGNIYEGRAGSLTQAIVGAHAGGFNSRTVGVAMLGTYTAVPPAAMQKGVAQIVGWRLGAYGLDPRGSMVYYTGAQSGAKFHDQNVSLPRLFGHRDVWLTACPGNGGYSALPNIRNMAASYSYAQRFMLAQPIVKALYQDLLLRAADPDGLQFWSATIAGGKSQAALVDTLTKSPEYVRLRIKAAYLKVLGRAADQGGLAGWTTGVLAGTVSVDDVQLKLYASGEFYARSGATSEGFVSSLYDSALGRPAAAQEASAWGALVDLNGSASVLRSIWFSNEAAALRAASYYQLFLQRVADPTGRASWAQILLARGEGAVRLGIAGSPEYKALAITRFP